MITSIHIVVVKFLKPDTIFVAGPRNLALFNSLGIKKIADGIFWFRMLESVGYEDI